ncbi:MAG: glycosyltransferase [Actinophytocola sp.]|nr:glycosyltransferase [Actinophytocola sp.]
MPTPSTSQQRNYGDELAVVTVTYSPGETLERFLDTLAKATTRPVRVILADNGSTDGAPEKGAERDGVQLVRTGGNLGYGSGANVGVAELDDTVGWVVVCNPDLEWEPGALDTLLEAAERWPRAGALGPLIKEPDGTIYPSARLLPSIGRGIGHAVFSKIWPRNPWTRAYRQESGTPTERTAGWLSGSCMLLRRTAFDDVDGFDRRYFMYFEDVDLCDRLGKAGWQNVYVPSAAVMHIQGHSTGKESARMLAVHHDSAYRYLADRHTSLAAKPMLAVIRIGLTLRAKLAARWES